MMSQLSQVRDSDSKFVRQSPSVCPAEVQEDASAPVDVGNGMKEPSLNWCVLIPM